MSAAFGIDDVRLDAVAFEKNRARQNFDHVDECFACGRGLTEKALANGWWIEMLVTGEFIAADDPRSHDDAVSQGTFPLGSECAKKVPRNLRRKL